MGLDEDVYADEGPMLRRLAIAMIILSTLSIVLRLWSRTIAVQTKLWWDDWLALCTWGCAMSCAGLLLAGVDLGVGKHVEAIQPPSNLYRFLKLFYVSQIVFDFGIACAKYSVLLFYCRVFTTRPRRFKVGLWTTAALVTVFILFKLPGQIFSCVPPRKNWEPSTPGHCEGDLTNFGIYLTGLILDVATDLMILILPMPLVSRLQMNKGRKSLVLAAFFCGYATWVASIGRMGAVIKTKENLDSPDISWHQVPVLAWSQAEISIAVISICLPSWFYLIKRASQNGVTSLFSTSDMSVSPGRVIRGGPQAPSETDGFTRLNDRSLSSKAVEDTVGLNCKPSATASGSPNISDARFNDASGLELGQVGVKRDVLVSGESRL